ncbi:MAG: tRNA uridine-5-carboxymethylaminomethyl(34) synthesis enzyme MnmG, partial [Syntrophales bacterium]|nr:tRNA uridine-5-carboxymethylaminomethyl(34) synthesis enzyme MnmG [Syntrophales bacterium]
LNAARKAGGQEPVRMSRAESYIGVLIDDLVTRGVSEPYRMFTSRAEYRLILREDNALLRLAERGHEIGLVDATTAERIKERKRRIADGIERLSHQKIYPVAETNALLERLGTTPIRSPLTLFQLLKRDGITYDDLQPFPGWEPIPDRHAKRQIEIEAKYEGYVKRQREAVAKLRSQEQKRIPPDLDYNAIAGLSNELRMKLAKVRPLTIAQAERIPGMTGAAVGAILIAMKKREAAG